MNKKKKKNPKTNSILANKLLIFHFFSFSFQTKCLHMTWSGIHTRFDVSSFTENKGQLLTPKWFDSIGFHLDMLDKKAE